MNRRFLQALLMCSASAVTLARGGSVVSDGGFELPTPSGTVGYTGSLGDGWTTTQGTIGILNAADGEGGVPHSANQFAYLDWSNTVNTLSQTLTTVAGQSYSISYWVTDLAPNTLIVSFDGQTLFSGTAPTNGVGAAADYVNYNFIATASSTSTVLSFTGQWIGGENNYGTILDDVTVTSTAIPEPANIAMTGFGVLWLWLNRRRLLRTPAPRGSTPVSRGKPAGSSGRRSSLSPSPRTGFPARAPR